MLEKNCVCRHVPDVVGVNIVRRAVHDAGVVARVVGSSVSCHPLGEVIYQAATDLVRDDAVFEEIFAVAAAAICAAHEQIDSSMGCNPQLDIRFEHRIQTRPGS
jgi:hypothetical protein